LVKDELERSNRFLDLPLDLGPRLFLIVAALLLLSTYGLPLWRVTVIEPEHREGLHLFIHSSRIGGEPAAVEAANRLNRSIGMRELSTSDVREFQWMPFGIGILSLLLLRAAVLGKMSEVVDAFVLTVYFDLFSLWSFGYRLYRYGHDLSPDAPVKVAPFMPPLFGRKDVATWGVLSSPALGSYALAAVAALVASAIGLAWREAREQARQEVRAALAG
jgi:copper chaperone NosL